MFAHNSLSNLHEQQEVFSYDSFSKERIYYWYIFLELLSTCDCTQDFNWYSNYWVVYLRKECK